MEAYKNVDEYIDQFSVEVREILIKIREVANQAAPGAIETISYGMPTLKLNGKNLVHFAAFKNHIGFYPTPSGTENFQKEIAPYVHGKGSIQFPLDESIPYELIEKITKFRVSEILSS